MRTRQGWFTTLMGLGAVGCAVVGIVSFVLALISALNGEFQAAGVCFIASALAFGLLLLGLLPR